MQFDEISGRPVEYAMVPGSDSDIVGTDGSWWKKGTRGWARRRVRGTGIYRKIRIGGKAFNFQRVILATFLGPPPANRPFGLHADDNPDNNRLDNLRWGLDADNTADKLRNVLTRAERHLRRPGLTESQANTIRRDHERRLARCQPDALPPFASPLRRTSDSPQSSKSTAAPSVPRSNTVSARSTDPLSDPELLNRRLAILRKIPESRVDL